MILHRGREWLAGSDSTGSLRRVILKGDFEGKNLKEPLADPFSPARSSDVDLYLPHMG